MELQTFQYWQQIRMLLDALDLEHLQYVVWPLLELQIRTRNITFWGALITPMLYPNCKDPSTAVKTESTRVPVIVYGGHKLNTTERNVNNNRTHDNDGIVLHLHGILIGMFMWVRKVVNCSHMHGQSVEWSPQHIAVQVYIHTVRPPTYNICYI